MIGPNAIRSHGARWLEVLPRQVKSKLLLLLAAAAVTSLIIGEQTDAAIILGIITLSVGLGFFNEYRAARAVEELHSRIRHTTSALRQGHALERSVSEMMTPREKLSPSFRAMICDGNGADSCG